MICFGQHAVLICASSKPIFVALFNLHVFKQTNVTLLCTL